MKKALVACFSASGVTANVADRLAAGIGADRYDIIPKVAYTNADLNWKDDKSRSSVEMKDPACRPEIGGEPLDITSYEVIFVGFPIWWYREPSIIDTFMEAYDFKGKQIVPFATSGSSGMGDAGKNMAAIAAGATVDAGKRFAADVAETELANWAKEWL